MSREKPLEGFDDGDPGDATTVRLPVLKEPLEIEAPRKPVNQDPDGRTSEDRRKR